jgi:hypothetical protein
MREFAQLRLSDAKVEDILLRRYVLTINIRLWDEKRVKLLITGVIHLEVGSQLHEDISHAVEEKEGDLVEKACQRAGDPTTNYASYSLISAWNGQANLVAVGEGWQLIADQGGDPGGGHPAGES